MNSFIQFLHNVHKLSTLCLQTVYSLSTQCSQTSLNCLQQVNTLFSHCLHIHTNACSNEENWTKKQRHLKYQSKLLWQSDDNVNVFCTHRCPSQPCLCMKALTSLVEGDHLMCARRELNLGAASAQAPRKASGSRWPKCLVCQCPKLRFLQHCEDPACLQLRNGHIIRNRI